MILSFRMTRNFLVLWMGLLMVFQMLSRVRVQPSRLVLPHIPWLSGVATPQRKGTVGSVAATLVTATSWGGPVVGSVFMQPEASTGTMSHLVCATAISLRSVRRAGPDLPRGHRVRRVPAVSRRNWGTG